MRGAGSYVVCRRILSRYGCCFFFQAEDGIRDYKVTGVQTCALPISLPGEPAALCSNALAYSRTAWRRSPIPSSLAPEPESFVACAARARRLLGTGLSIL